MSTQSEQKIQFVHNGLQYTVQLCDMVLNIVCHCNKTRQEWNYTEQTTLSDLQLFEILRDFADVKLDKNIKISLPENVVLLNPIKIVIDINYPYGIYQVSQTLTLVPKFNEVELDRMHISITEEALKREMLHQEAIIAAQRNLIRGLKEDVKNLTLTNIELTKEIQEFRDFRKTYEDDFNKLQSMIVVMCNRNVQKFEDIIKERIDNNNEDVEKMVNVALDESADKLVNCVSTRVAKMLDDYGEQHDEYFRIKLERFRNEICDTVVGTVREYLGTFSED